MLQVVLELDGHEVVAAVNGEEGWAKFQGGTFPVVISDWLMPGIDGLELCRRVRALETTRYCYIMLLTALQGKSNYLEGMRAGADDFVSTPFAPAEFRATLFVPQR